MDKLNYLEKELGKGKIKVNEPLFSYTTFKIGGPAEFFYKARTTDEIIKAVIAAQKLKINWQILGSGSNVLISDKILSGLTIRNEAMSIRILKRLGKVTDGKTQVNQVLLEADSGVLMNSLVRYACDEGLAGLERHLGLPGTVGGAIYNNSKWTNPISYTGDLLYQAKILTQAGIIKTVSHNYFKFAYDYSILQKTHDIVLTATFLLNTASKQKLWEIANNSIVYRQKNQPMGVATAGCTFKNISLSEAMRICTPNSMTSTGYLLDQVGLKNYTIGKAKFSEKHANFIINTGGASSSDVISLIREAQARVKAKYNVSLELEIELWGDFN